MRSFLKIVMDLIALLKQTFRPFVIGNLIIPLSFVPLSFVIYQTSAAEPARADLDFFESKIRPVLVESCYKCHSAESERVKGGLLLDSREGLLKGGETGPSIVPGDPDKSKLIIALRYKDEHLQMPPKEPLSSEVVANFEKWVKMGAPDPRVAKIAKATGASTNHWSFQPVKERPVPKIKNRKWIKQSIDAFILADLEERRFEPAPAADKRTLIRRATFDLTGLPPTPEEIDAFLADSSTNAFEIVVDRLLKSPAFGERWGRHWLDLARYSDSNGLEFNTPFPNAYRYRDYVIASFNNDKPYDQFIREQIAGDLLPTNGSVEDQHEKWIATGFLTLGPKALNVGMPEKVIADIVDEQIDVTSKAFLGLTVACARCHDHKFDPIPTRDYYALAGIFQSTATLNAGGNGRNQNPFGNAVSERPLGTKEESDRAEKHQQELSRAETDLQTMQSQIQDTPGGINSKELEGIVVDNLQAEVIGNWRLSNYSTNFVDKNYLASGDDVKGEKMVRFRPNIPKTGVYEVRLAYTPHLNRATNVPVRIKSGTNVTTKLLNQREPPQFNKAFTYLGLFDLEEGTNNVVELSNEKTRGFIVVDAVQFLPLDKQNQMAMAPGMQPPPAKMDRQRATFAGNEIYDQQDKIAEIRAKAPPPLPAAMAVREGAATNARIAIRGEVDRLGDEVPRGFINVIDRRPAKKDFAKDSSGRLELADWIASPENPLTARVYANRVWQHLFGRALVNTPDNFGLQGEAPSNPDLLDYLATQFVSQGWSTKKLIREVMLSSAYQMSAQHNPSAYQKDPDNRLVWRMDRRRLEAEAFRDAILAVSGTLDNSRGGPVITNNINNRFVPPDGNLQFPASNKRSVYLPTVRNNLDDLYAVFDFPDPHAPSGKRHITSAATQALYVMNSPFVIDQSKSWAQRLTALTNLDDPARIRRAFIEAFAREPNDRELLRATAFLKEFHEAAATKEPDDTARRQLSWQALCQGLIATAEFRYLN